MNKYRYKKNFLLFFGVCMLLACTPLCAQNAGQVTIQFKNVVNGEPVTLYNKSYTNPFGEEFKINKLRYYISNIQLTGSTDTTEIGSTIYLIDEAKDVSQKIQIPIPAGKYSALHFQIGVDSVYNVSGAQSGVLDPVEDMFWTWHTGYVMAKMEGTSPSSKVVNGKYEFHIGGFSGNNNVLKTVSLPLQTAGGLTVTDNTSARLFITADMNTWFKGPHDIRIADRPAINSPGRFAVAMSENYIRMFTVNKIEYEE